MSNQISLSHKFSSEACGIVKIAEILNDRWTILLLREAFYGVTKFNDFMKNTGISKQILSNRLKHLVELNILKLSLYKEMGTRERQEYLLTSKGRSLNVVLLAMLESGGHFLSEEEPVVKIFQKDQDAALRLKLFNENNQVVSINDVELRTVCNSKD